MTESFSGTVTGVYALDLGDKLAAAAAVGATVLTLYSVVDFVNDDGGFLRLNDVVLAYTDADVDTNTVTLAAGLTAAAAVDDVVDVWDLTNGQTATVYKAVVDDIDGFSGKPAEAYVSQAVAHVLATTMRDGQGETVTLTRDQGALKVTEVHGRVFSLAALQYLQGGMTTRQSDDDPGVDILGVDSGAPGIYVYGTNGSQIILRDDGSEGIIEFSTGDPGEIAPGSINPSVDGGTHQLEFQTSYGSAPFDEPGDMILIASASGIGPHLQLFQTGLTVIGAGITATNEIHAGQPVGTGGLFSDNLEGGGTTGASLNNGGKLIRTTSSLRYKDNIQPMTLETAQKVLALESVTFQLKDETDDPNRRTYPGFIAEQAADAGAELWVARDTEGRLGGFRYGEVTAAHNMLLRDMQTKIDELTRLVDQLQGGTSV